MGVRDDPHQDQVREPSGTAERAGPVRGDPAPRSADRGGVPGHRGRAQRLDQGGQGAAVRVHREPAERSAVDRYLRGPPSGRAQVGRQSGPGGHLLRHEGGAAPWRCGGHSQPQRHRRRGEGVPPLGVREEPPGGVDPQARELGCRGSSVGTAGPRGQHDPAARGGNRPAGSQAGSGSGARPPGGPADHPPRAGSPPSGPAAPPRRSQAQEARLQVGVSHPRHSTPRRSTVKPNERLFF